MSERKGKTSARTRQLLIWVGVLIILSGVYLVLKKQPTPIKTDSAAQTAAKAAAKADTKAPVASPAPTYPLTQLKDSRITRLAFIAKNSVIILDKRRSGWTVVSPYPVQLSAAAVGSLVTGLAALTADKLIASNPADLTQYGLASPVATATITQTNPKTRQKLTVELYLGAVTPSGDSSYVMVKGDPRVYAVSAGVAQSLATTLSDLRDKSLAAIDPRKLTYFLLTRPGLPPLEIQASANQSAAAAQYNLGTWVMTQPYPEPCGVNGEKFQKILAAVGGLGAMKDIVADNPGDLNQYGLAGSRSELLVKDRHNTLHLWIGKVKDETSVYCKTPDSNTVFTVAKDSLSFLDNRAFDLVDKFAFIVNIAAVDHIVIRSQNPSRSHTIVLGQKRVREKGRKSETVNTYQIDGKNIAEEHFKNYYQNLIGLMVEAENDRMTVDHATDGSKTAGLPAAGRTTAGRVTAGRPAAPVNPEVQTNFFFKKDSGQPPEVRIDYLPYNNDFYAVSRNGRAPFLISREQVQKMLANLEALLRKG